MPARSLQEVLDSREHLITRLDMRDVPAPAGHLAVELDLTVELSNTRGGLQGGLISLMVDVVAGRLALERVPSGWGTATADMTVHYLAPVVQGPARIEAQVLRHGSRSIVCHVDVHDVGRDRLAAVGTISFVVLEPRPDPTAEG